MSCVVSVELVTVTLGSTTTTATVNTTKGQVQAQCAPLFVSKSMDGNGTSSDAYGTTTQVQAKIVNNGGTTAVTCTRTTANSAAITVHVHVVEFIDDINVYEILAFNTAIGATVDLAYSFAVTSAYNNTVSANNDDQNYYLTLGTTSHSWTNYVNGSGSSSWATYVIEDSTGGTHFTVETFSGTMTGFSSFVSCTIGSVDVTKSFVLGTWQSQDEGSGANEANVHCVLTTATNVNATRSSAGSNREVYVKGFVVELQADDAAVYDDFFDIASTSDTGNDAIGATLSVNSCAHITNNSYLSGVDKSSLLQRWSDSEIRISIDAQRDGVDVARTRINDSAVTIWWQAIDWGINLNRRLFIT